MPYSKDTKRYPYECFELLQDLDADPEAVFRFPCDDEKAAESFARRLGYYRDAVAKDDGMTEALKGTAHAMRVSIEGKTVIVMHRDHSPEAKILRRGLDDYNRRKGEQ